MPPAPTVPSRQSRPTGRRSTARATRSGREPPTRAPSPSTRCTGQINWATTASVTPTSRARRVRSSTTSLTSTTAPRSTAGPTPTRACAGRKPGRRTRTPPAPDEERRLRLGRQLRTARYPLRRSSSLVPELRLRLLHQLRPGRLGVDTSPDGQWVVFGGEFPRVNNVAQQGIVRFRTAAGAPNTSGPTYTTTPATPIPATTAVSFSAGKARVIVRLGVGHGRRGAHLRRAA